MMHLISDCVFAFMAFLSFFGGIWLSATLGLIVFVCLISALVIYEDKFDAFDRLALGGLAGSMVMTTPTLFFDLPGLDGWSFNLARFFLALIAIRRFGVPVVWDFIGRRRQGAQLASSGRANAFRDSLKDRL